jgi:hypothetical protein
MRRLILTASLHVECGSILRLEPPFGLSLGKHGKFSLLQWLARGGSLVSTLR